METKDDKAQPVRSVNPQRANINTASQANILSNLSFLLVDMAETCFMEARELLAKDGFDIKHEAKFEFNLMFKHARNLKKYVRKCSESTQEWYGDDSDMMYQTMKLILDRSGDDDVKMFKFFNYIKTFPSQLGLDIDDSAFSGVFEKASYTQVKND